MKDISVLFPYKPDNGPRDVAFKWVLEFYKKYMPEVEICIGEGVCKGNLFSRSKAINNAAKMATRDIFVIADNDIFYDPEIIIKSIKLLKKYVWVIPFERKHFIEEGSTNELLRMPPHWPISIEIEKSTPDTMKKSGVNIVPRENFEKVKGFDERFCGWGGEDNAFVWALNTLCGRYARLDADIFHLWHSHGGQKKGHDHYKENKALVKRYSQARRSIEEMENLINEQF